MEQKNESGKTAKAVAQALAHIAEGFAEIAGVVNEFVLAPTAEEIRQKIARARQTEVEELPPAVVQYWIATKDILARKGYVLTFGIRNWFANPDYNVIAVLPLREGDALFHDKPPIAASFIVSKKTGRVALGWKFLNRCSSTTTASLSTMNLCRFKGLNYASKETGLMKSQTCWALRLLLLLRRPRQAPD